MMWSTLSAGLSFSFLQSTHPLSLTRIRRATVPHPFPLDDELSPTCRLIEIPRQRFEQCSLTCDGIETLTVPQTRQEYSTRFMRGLGGRRFAILRQTGEQKSPYFGILHGLA